MAGRWLPNLPGHLRGEEAVSQLSCQVILLLTVVVVVVFVAGVGVVVVVVSC